jgi:hypothetical protein
MMHKHLNTLKDIIKQTVAINRALDDESTPFSTVQVLIKERQTLTDRFSEQAAAFNAGEATADPVEFGDILEQFQQQQTLMQRKLEHRRSESKEHLAQAVKHRKALQGYGVSKTPDISYF